MLNFSCIILNLYSNSLNLVSFLNKIPISSKDFHSLIIFNDNFKSYLQMFLFYPTKIKKKANK
jgi:hypothetical protein